MPNDRARVFPYSSAAPVNGSEIYLIGGTGGAFDEDLFPSESSKKVDIYDTTSDSWHKVQDLPLPIDNHLSVIVGSKVYILGGCNNHDYYNRSKNEVISGNIN